MSQSSTSTSVGSILGSVIWGGITLVALACAVHFAIRTQHLQTELSMAADAGQEADESPKPSTEEPLDIQFVNELHHADDDLPEEDKRQYDAARDYLLDVDNARRFDAEARKGLNERELAADKALAALREKEIDGYLSHNEFPPANAFYKGVAEIPKSEVFRLLRAMPKGGALHLHASSTGRAETILNLTKEEECLVEVTQVENQAISITGKMALPSDTNSIPLNHKPAAEVREKMGDKEFEEILTDRLTLDLEDELSKDVWHEFSSAFNPYGAALAYERVFEQYFVDAFEQMIADNIDYVELRTGIAQVINLDGTTTDTVEQFWEMRNKIREKHPDFDFKLIISAWRGNAHAGGDRYELRTEDVRKSLEQAMEKRQKHKDFIIGFDLVGHEDRGRRTDSFRDVFLDLPAYRKKYGVDMALYFHDGESVWADDLNVVDAYLVGAKRIGHGLNLYLFPTLQDRLIQQDIALEVCPISNQILGYVRDLRTHPAVNYMRRGVPIVLSSDDPAIFGYAGVSHDFWVAYMAWDLDLASLKQLARNSIRYSGMNDQEKKAAYQRWEAKWEKYIEQLLADDAVKALAKAG